MFDEFSQKFILATYPPTILYQIIISVFGFGVVLVSRPPKKLLLLPLLGWLAANSAFIYFAFQPVPLFSAISNRSALFLLSTIFLFHILELGSNKPRLHTGLLSLAVTLTMPISLIPQFGVFAGLIYLAMTVNSLREKLSTQRQYFIRNQLYYWVLVISCIASAGYALQSNMDVVFDFFLPLAMVSSIMVSCIQHLPDVKFVVRGVLRSGLLLLWLALLFFGVITAYKQTGSILVMPLVSGIGLALAVVTVPLADRFLERMLVMLFSQDRQPADHLIETISVALREKSSLADLSKVFEKVIVDECYATSFHLVIADYVAKSNAEDEYHLYNHSAIPPMLADLTLSGSGVTSSWFNRQQNSISYHSDLEATLLANEGEGSALSWFNALQGFLYVPLFDQQQWIGFISVGPRRRGGYEREEMIFFTALSSIAGKAIVNAKLVDKLTKSNAELEQSFSTLQNITKDMSTFEVIKSNFISIASHELRTPLTVTRGYVEMLLEDQTLPSTQRDLLNGIYKGVLKQEEILDSLFELARLDLSSDIMRTEELSLNDILREVTQKVSKQVNQRQQVLVVDLPSLPRIVGDRASVRRLFLNIVQNAIKFTPDHGKITISAFIPPSENQQEAGIQVVIRDTGVGVSKELQDIIFTRFYQPGEKVDHLSSSKFRFKGSGLGLGLALSRAIIKAHGGRIWVVSPSNTEEGLPGSEFHLFFPFQPQNQIPTA